MTCSKRILPTSKHSIICLIPRYVDCAIHVGASNVDGLQEPKLWYGIGILYDRYGSLEHAEEAFSQVMRMEPNFEKANEIYFRLGIIYKQQQKFNQSLDVSR
jgi:tetratricopeptide (TPR) repeat protein